MLDISAEFLTDSGTDASELILVFIEGLRPTVPILPAMTICITDVLETFRLCVAVDFQLLPSYSKATEALPQMSPIGRHCPTKHSYLVCRYSRSECRVDPALEGKITTAPTEILSQQCSFVTRILSQVSCSVAP